MATCKKCGTEYHLGHVFAVPNGEDHTPTDCRDALAAQLAEARRTVTVERRLREAAEGWQRAKQEWIDVAERTMRGLTDALAEARRRVAAVAHDLEHAVAMAEKASPVLPVVAVPVLRRAADDLRRAHLGAALREAARI